MPFLCAHPKGLSANIDYYWHGQTHGHELAVVVARLEARQAWGRGQHRFTHGAIDGTEYNHARHAPIGPHYEA